MRERGLGGSGNDLLRAHLPEDIHAVGLERTACSSIDLFTGGRIAAMIPR